MTAAVAEFWAVGDYDRIARLIGGLGTAVVEAAGVRAGDRVLDLAAGTGNAAFPAAERGASVTAVDVTPALVDTGRRRARRRGLDIDWRVGDVQDLPFADGSFDVVLLVGVMFAADQQRAAAELIRVCRPGATVALASWTPAGAAGEMFDILDRHLGASPPPQPPTGWGVAARVADLLGARCSSLTSRTHRLDARFDRPPRALVDHYRTYFPPVLLAYRALSDTAALDDDLLAWATRLWERPPGGCYSYEYLLTVGRVG